eukprot:1611522-Prymnesium_polylepis.1
MPTRQRLNSARIVTSSMHLRRGLGSRKNWSTPCASFRCIHTKCPETIPTRLSCERSPRACKWKSRGTAILGSPTCDGSGAPRTGASHDNISMVRTPYPPSASCWCADAPLQVFGRVHVSDGVPDSHARGNATDGPDVLPSPRCGPLRFQAALQWEGLGRGWTSSREQTNPLSVARKDAVIRRLHGDETRYLFAAL